MVRLRGEIGRTAYANATSGPCWNAVKTDGANQARKTVTHPWQPSGRWVTFGPGSAVLAYACTLLRRVYTRERAPHICSSSWRIRFTFPPATFLFESATRAPRREEKKNSRSASTGIILLRERERDSDRNFINSAGIEKWGNWRAGVAEILITRCSFAERVERGASMGNFWRWQFLFLNAN